MQFERTEAKIKELVQKKMKEYLNLYRPVTEIPDEVEEFLEDFGYSCLLTGLEIKLDMIK